MPYGLSALIDWAIKNREWVFSGIGVFTLGLVLSAILLLWRRYKARRGQSKSPTLITDSRSSSATEEAAVLKPTQDAISNHIVDYVINLPLDPNITEQELAIISKFVAFPRGQNTQGYRLDWIYSDLLKDIPSGSAHLILENLVAKGHLERWSTRQGNTYYRISDAGRAFLVDNKLICLTNG